MQKSLKTLAIFLLTLVTLPVSAFEESRTYKEIIKKDPESNYVFIFVYRSAAYLDWSSPSNLAWTSIQSEIAKKVNSDASSIGHAQIAWHCHDKGGNLVSGATGQTGDSNDQDIGLLLKGWGLSILDAVFTDGMLESEQVVESRMKIADKTKNFSWMAIKTTSDACLGLSNFVHDYDKSGAAKNYGFPVDPFKFEGAGCTSFANAAVTKTELKIPLSEAWVRHVRVPKKYMGKLDEGHPLTKLLEMAKNKDEIKKIPLSSFLFGNVAWAKENEEYKDFYYYDPELFYESMIHLENKYREFSGIRSKNPLRSKTYDSSQLKTRQISESWFNDLLSNNKRIKMDKIHNTTGLIINY